MKGSNYLEALNHVNSVVFDKTGTLTKGVFKVTDLVPAEGFTREQLLEAAALAEVYSTHPIAKSILEAYSFEANKKIISKERIDLYEEMAGLGVKVVVEGKTIYAGNRKLLAQVGITLDKPEVFGTVVHVIIDSEYAGYLLISDEVKEDSASAIAGLKQMGIRRLVMLSGDDKDSCSSCCRRIKAS